MFLSKQQFKTEDGSIIEGIRITLAPKISKFFALSVNGNNDNLMLLKTFNSVVYAWYEGSEFNESTDWHKYCEDHLNELLDIKEGKKNDD